MKIGDRVALKDVPAIVGTVIAMHACQAKVYWSSHTTQWVDVEALMVAGKKKQVERT